MRFERASVYRGEDAANANIRTRFRRARTDDRGYLRPRGFESSPRKSVSQKVSGSVAKSFSSTKISSSRSIIGSLLHFSASSCVVRLWRGAGSLSNCQGSGPSVSRPGFLSRQPPGTPLRDCSTGRALSTGKRFRSRATRTGRAATECRFPPTPATRANSPPSPASGPGRRTFPQRWCLARTFPRSVAAPG